MATTQGQTMSSVLQRLRAAKSELYDAEAQALRLRKEIAELESSLTMFIGGSQVPLTQSEGTAAAHVVGGSVVIRPARPPVMNQPLDAASPLTAGIVGANRALLPKSVRVRAAEELSDDGGETVSGAFTDKPAVSSLPTAAGVALRRKVDVDSDDDALCGQVGDGCHLLDKDDEVSIAALKNAMIEFSALSAAVNSIQVDRKDFEQTDEGVASYGVCQSVGVKGIRAMRKDSTTADVTEEYDEGRASDDAELVRQLK